MIKSLIKMEKISLVKSSFLNEEETKTELCKFIMDSNRFSMFEQCKTFEERFALKQKRKYAIFVSSGSNANLILIQGLLNKGKLKRGDKVFVSSLTWATNVMPLIQLGIEPVPLDCSLKTLNVDIETLKKTFEENRDIKGLFLTNVLGMCSEIDEISKYCEENGILFFEDNCESLGSEYQEKLLGNFGLASTFSFFVGHHISTIEGGMICTDDYELAEQLIMSRAHGWSRNNSKETDDYLKEKYETDDFYSDYSFYELGYNFRPTEINGFIGNIQLKYWDFIVNTRKKNFETFLEATRKNDSIIKLEIKGMNKISNFAFPLLFKDKESFLRYKELFIQNNIEIRPIIAGNIAKQPFFQKYVKKYDCKNADFIHKHGFYIPNNPELTPEEIKRIVSLIKNYNER